MKSEPDGLEPGHDGQRPRSRRSTSSFSWRGRYPSRATRRLSSVCFAVPPDDVLEHLPRIEIALQNAPRMAVLRITGGA